MKLILTLFLTTLAGSLLHAQTIDREQARQEFIKVNKEKSKLKSEYNKLTSEIWKTKPAEMVDVENRFRKSIVPINKAMETHPDFAALRKQRDDAQAAYFAAQKAKDGDAAKKALSEKTKANNSLYKAIYRHKDVIPLIKAREALGKEREAVKRKLAIAKNKSLVDQLDAAKKRSAELRQILYGKK